MKSNLNSLVALLGSVILLGSCNKLKDFLPKPKEKLSIYRGTPVDLWNGKATGWISVSHLGAPVEIGLEITKKALTDLPDTNFSVASIPLPARAKELTPFEHIQIEWSAQGHGLAGADGPVHFGPHYDPRFFMQTLEERLQIPVPTDSSAKFDVHPPAGYMPSNFFPGRTALPGIGLHWVDFSGVPGIRKALILGTYNGEFTFISPIVLAEEMRSGNSSSTAFLQPLYFQESNTYYPTKYNIYADDAKQKHYITLSDFVLR
jgi:hypothetical protein